MKQEVPRRSAGWDSILPILAVILFVTVLLLLLSVAEPAEDAKELARSLLSELVGFAFTAGAVGWLLKAHESRRREEILKRQREIAAAQHQNVHVAIRPVLAGRAALGPQYLPDVVRAIAALERLEADCGDVVANEHDAHLAEGWARLRTSCRELLLQLATLQLTLGDGTLRDSMPLPPSVADRIREWEESSSALSL